MLHPADSGTTARMGANPLIVANISTLVPVGTRGTSSGEVPDFRSTSVPGATSSTTSLARHGGGAIGCGEGCAACNVGAERAGARTGSS
jgi:hypothetical protein